MADYSVDDDPGAGGSHHQPVAATPYSLDADPGVGGATQQSPAKPPMLTTSWQTIMGDPKTWQDPTVAAATPEMGLASR